MKSYFTSITGMTAMQYVEMTNNTFSVFTVILQLIIFGFTAYKLWYDIKYHKFKSLEKTEKETEKKHKFIFNIFKLIKKW